MQVKQAITVHMKFVGHRIENFQKCFNQMG